MTAPVEQLQLVEPGARALDEPLLWERRVGAREVGGLGATKMFCTTDGVMPQEAAYLSALGQATVYSVAGRQLFLGPVSGAVSLVFDAE